MTGHDDLEQRLPDYLANRAPTPPPGVLDAILRETAGLPQRLRRSAFSAIGWLGLGVAAAAAAIVAAILFGSGLVSFPMAPGSHATPTPAPASLDPVSVPVVLIGFEGQTDTFPSPGGIVPALVRATVSDPNGQNPRSWSVDASKLESLKADTGGYAPSGLRTRFAFSLGARMLNIPLSHATSDSPGLHVVAAPWGGTLVVDNAAGANAWVEVSVVFDDSIDGHPARIDATYGFGVMYPPPPP